MQRSSTTSGAPLVITSGFAIGSVDQHRSQLPLVVEGEHASPDVTGGLDCDVPSRRRRGSRPQGLVQRVPPDRPVFGDRRFVADQPEQQGAIALLAARRRGSARR